MEYRKGRDDGTQEGRRTARWDTGKEGIVGHRKGRGTAKWDVKERGLPGGALHRKREHSQGRTAYDVKLPTVKGEKKRRKRVDYNIDFTLSLPATVSLKADPLYQPNGWNCCNV